MNTFEKAKGKPLYEQVREHLREQCLGHEPELALPSLRQLSESLGVNHITISKALRELEAEGVIKIIPGKGTFVASAGGPARGVEMITLYTERQYLLDTSRHTFEGMQQGLPAGLTLTGSTLVVPPFPKPEVFVQGLKTRGIAAAAIFGFGYLPYPDSYLETQFIHELAQQMPVVLVGKEHPLLKLDCVLCDPVPQMRGFLEECYAAGTRRFSYLGAQDDQTHLRHRLEGFQDFLLARGLKWERPENAGQPQSNREVVSGVLDTEPEVVVASAPNWGQALVIEAHRRGLTPGEDLQILCFAGYLSEVQGIEDYVHVVLLQEEEVGRCLIHRLSARLNGEDKPAPLTRRVPGKLIRLHAPEGAAPEHLQAAAR